MFVGTYLFLLGRADMRTATYPRMIAVSGSTFTEAIEKVNAIVFEHRGDNPHYEKATDDGLNWIVHYTETEQLAETIADEKYLKHDEVICKDCEYCQRILKADGTVDERTKKAYCEKFDRCVYLTSKAKDECYRLFEEVE